MKIKKMLSAIVVLAMMLSSFSAKAQCLSGGCNDGYGIYLLENGTKYIGLFSDGKPFKHGVVFYKNGDKYVGNWSDWKKNGNGTLFKSNGKSEHGTWKADELINDKKLVGCISGDCKNGKGVYIYQDNTRYEGEFKDGLANGTGVCFYADGSVYSGQWKHHNYNGLGVKYGNDGQLKIGNWQNGTLTTEEKK